MSVTDTYVLGELVQTYLGYNTCVCRKRLGDFLLKKIFQCAIKAIVLAEGTDKKEGPPQLAFVFFVVVFFSFAGIFDALQSLSQ